jgi:hypothetical protein
VKDGVMLWPVHLLGSIPFDRLLQNVSGISFLDSSLALLIDSAVIDFNTKSLGIMKVFDSHEYDLTKSLYKADPFPWLPWLENLQKHKICALQTLNVSVLRTITNSDVGMEVVRIQLGNEQDSRQFTNPLLD